MGYGRNNYPSTSQFVNGSKNSLVSLGVWYCLWFTILLLLNTSIPIIHLGIGKITTGCVCTFTALSGTNSSQHSIHHVSSRSSHFDQYTAVAFPVSGYYKNLNPVIINSRKSTYFLFPRVITHPDKWPRPL